MQKRSTTMTTQKKPKRPSLALRKKLKPLIDAATQGLILSGPTTEGQGAYPQVVVVWPLLVAGGSTPDMPEGFPRGYVLDRTVTTVRMKHDCKKLVNWFYKHGYIAYNASDIMKGRRDVMLSLVEINRGIEKLLDINQEFVI